MSKIVQEEKNDEPMEDQVQQPEKMEETTVALRQPEENDKQQGTQYDVVQNKTEPPNSPPPAKSPRLQHLVEAVLRDDSSPSPSPHSAVLMEHQLKRSQDERLNACKKIMNYVNSADFSTLNDKEIRTLLLIREISCAVIIGQRKLPNDHDVSRVLKDSIERMVVTCRKMVDQISGMDFHDLNEQERQSLTIILKIAREIISKQGAQYEDGM